MPGTPAASAAPGSVASGGSGRRGRGRAVAARGAPRGAECPTREAVGTGRRRGSAPCHGRGRTGAGPQGGVRGRDSRARPRVCSVLQGPGLGAARDAGRRRPGAGHTPRHAFLTGRTNTHDLTALGSLQEEQARTHRRLLELTLRAGPSPPAHSKDGAGAGPGPRPGTAPETLERACCPTPRPRPPVTSGHATRDLRVAGLAKVPWVGPGQARHPMSPLGAASAVRDTPRREDARTRTASVPAAAPGTTCLCRLSPVCLHRAEQEL